MAAIAAYLQAAERASGPAWLAEARRLLTQVGGRHDVTHIALSMGFSHPGRFAALYRQAFGESPSQSLWRSRRKTLARASA